MTSHNFRDRMSYQLSSTTHHSHRVTQQSRSECHRRRCSTNHKCGECRNALLAKQKKKNKKPPRFLFFVSHPLLSRPNFPLLLGRWLLSLSFLPAFGRSPSLSIRNERRTGRKDASQPSSQSEYEYAVVTCQSCGEWGRRGSRCRVAWRSRRAKEGVRQRNCRRAIHNRLEIIALLQEEGAVERSCAVLAVAVAEEGMTKAVGICATGQARCAGIGRGGFFWFGAKHGSVSSRLGLLLFASLLFVFMLSANICTSMVCSAPTD
ncbi:hypothetical protein HDV57DRAFT_321864 [Trichoderma longibrachiatum]